MVGRVFISCGQRPGREKSVANEIGKLLREKFDLDSYIAIKVQGLNDIMKITQELRASDFYLFVDFLRPEKNGTHFSLFTHQELALAYNLGFKEMIALKEEGTPTEGFLRYIQSNPEPFSNDNELLEKIERLVKERKWNKDYSRNLVLENIELVGPLDYADQTGRFTDCVWLAKIRNRRSDAAAIDTACILDSIEHNGVTEPCYDRSNLKWARQMGYKRTIFPKDYGFIDVFSVRNSLGIFLHSALDYVPRQSILIDSGKYRLNYEVFSENFPLLSFSLDVDYHQPPGLPADLRSLVSVQIAK
jgi:hypothetical protein